MKLNYVYVYSQLSVVDNGGGPRCHVVRVMQ